MRTKLLYDSQVFEFNGGFLAAVFEIYDRIVLDSVKATVCPNIWEGGRGGEGSLKPFSYPPTYARGGGGGGPSWLASCITRTPLAKRIKVTRTPHVYYPYPTGQKN